MEWGGNVITLYRSAHIQFRASEIELTTGQLKPPTVVDSVVVPLRPWERVIPTCRVGHGDTGDYVALVVDSAGKALRTRRAWRLSISERRLVPVDSTQVVCFMEARDGD